MDEIGNLHWNVSAIAADHPLDIENPFDILLFELDAISNIQRGDTLCTSSEYITSEAKTYMNSLKRTVIKEDRFRDYKCIKQRVNLAMMFAELILDSRQINVYEISPSIGKKDLEEYECRVQKLVRIYDALKGLGKGLKNFKNSYTEDKKLETHVDLLMENITLFCTRLKDTLTKYTEKQLLFNMDTKKNIRVGNSSSAVMTTDRCNLSNQKTDATRPILAAEDALSSREGRSPIDRHHDGRDVGPKDLAPPIGISVDDTM